MPFDINVMLNLCKDTFYIKRQNAKVKFKLEILEIENDKIKTAQNNPYGYSWRVKNNKRHLKRENLIVWRKRYSNIHRCNIEEF